MTGPSTISANVVLNKRYWADQSGRKIVVSDQFRGLQSGFAN